MTQFVRSAVLTNYAEVARSVGLDPLAVVRSVGLDAACLHERDLRIPATQARRLLEDSSALSGVENFGLRMAETRRLSILGQVGLVARDAPTLRQMLTILIAHMRLHNESLMLHVEDAAGLATIRQDLVLNERGSMRQSVELSLGALMRILRIYLPAEWSPRRVCFVHQSPVDVSLHRRMFGHALEFGAEFDAVICKSADLETPIASSDPVMADYARRQVEVALKAELPPFEREMRQLILILLPSGRCTVDQAARHMAVDRRTIHRRLAQGGQTFSELVQAVRVELSDRYLEQRGRTMSEIAELLGFSSASAYTRWHQSGLDCTPSARREQLMRHH
jgi:AraC-like DNA-binding protein